MALSRSKAAIAKRKHRQRHPDREKARNLASKALMNGKLILRKCSVVGCRGDKVQMHHPRYDKPLEVIPLCHKHHVQFHKIWRLK